MGSIYLRLTYVNNSNRNNTTVKHETAHNFNTLCCCFVIGLTCFLCRLMWSRLAVLLFDIQTQHFGWGRGRGSLCGSFLSHSWVSRAHVSPAASEVCHMCVYESIYLSVFLSNEFLPFNKIAFDWTWPDGAGMVLLTGPEVLELTCSSYWQLMCKNYQGLV